MAGKSFVFRFADIEAHEREFSLVRRGETIAVEPKAFRVLLILLRNPQKLIPKEELLNGVWSDAAVTENSLTRAIALLRRVLGDDARNPRFIETVTTVGYRFVCPVEVQAFPEASESVEAEFPIAGDALNWRSRRAVWTALAVCVVLLTVGLWYLIRPLSPPRVGSYRQLTRDGRMKDGAFHDGSRVYFTFFSPNSIAQVASSGGESVPVPTRVQGQMDFAIDLSPEGSELLIASFPGHGSKDYIWRANVLSGEARRLVAAEWGTFSPDGKSILYATAKGDILESDLNGSGMHRLASPGGQLIRPLLSPDGKLIRFEKDGKLWEMKSDGSGTHPMLSDWQMPGEQAAGSWTPDGKLFLFALKGLGSGGDQIWAIDERRHFFWQKSPSPFQLTSGPIHWAEAISGRDGKTLFAPGRTPRGELVRIDPKTGVAVPYLGGISAEFPSFSQDGKYVAYVIFPEGILWKANRDGTGRLQLTQPPIYPMVPRWSPDGSEIAFSAPVASPDGHFTNYIVSADGGTPSRLLPEDNGEQGDPTWSPDGKRILFYHSTPGSLVQEDLRILDRGTHQVTQVPGSTGMYSPRWSPDGRYIVGLVRQSNQLRIYDFETKKWIVVAEAGGAGFLNFSRDSRTIYFVRYGTDQGIFSVGVNDGREKKLVDLNAFHFTGAVAVSMTLDPTDAPLVLRDIGTSDLYALSLDGK